MFILDRYVAGRFLRALTFSMLVLIVIYVIANLVESLDQFLDAQATTMQVVRYYVNFLPFIIVLMLPVAILLALLFSVGSLSKNNELVAMRASGVPLLRTARPLLGLGLLLSLMSLILAETVVPHANHARKEIKEYEIEKKEPNRRRIMYHVYRQGDDGRVFRLERYDIPGARGYQALIQSFDGSKLRWAIRADEMQWIQSVWILKRGELRLFESGDSVSVVDFDSLPRPEWREDPEAFAQPQKDPQSMGYFELNRWIEFKEKSGADTAKEKVELELKIAFPFACFMMVMIGVPIASAPKRAGFARSFGIAFGIVFVYFTFTDAMQSLGRAGDVPPLVAAWTMNIFFFAVGAVLFGLVRK